MDPPPLSAAAATTTASPQPYPDSLDSSPRSRHADSWDDPPLPATAANLSSSKLRLMCSYGGHIVPRPHDKTLCYVGGETRIIVVDRNVSLSSLTSRLSQNLLNGQSFSLKYQLPSEDLDSLISVTTDEDLENMIEEYERTMSNCQMLCRLRLFLFQQRLNSSQSILEGSTKSDEWFLSALNGATGVLNRGFSDSASVNCLLGLDDDIVTAAAVAAAVGGSGGAGGGLVKKIQDVHSVPDSPMMETTSSFGSSSSSPSLANLPPIKVHVDDNSNIKVVQDQKPVMGIEEQFGQLNVGAGGGGTKQAEEGFVVLSSPPQPPQTTVGVSSVVVPGEYVNRVFSDDERSDHGVPVGYRKAPAPQQSQTQPQKSSGGCGGLELPSPDSVSSDGSLSNAISRQKPMIYQDHQVMQIPSAANRIAVNPVDPKINVSEPNSQAHLQQQVQDSGSGYVLQQTQLERQQQQPPQQAQQFIHTGAHYIHHHPAGAVPISAYYPVHPSQQQPHHHPHHQLDQQYPVYYMSTRQPQAYNLSVQQPSTVSEAPTVVPSSRPQTPPSLAMVPPLAAYNPMRNAHIAKPEMATQGMYRTTAAGAPQLVQMPTNHQQQQYVGYAQIHHPSQSVTAPTSLATSNYGYEFADPAHAQIYYTQPLAPTITSQYQTMTGTATAVLPEPSGQLSSENIKQQIRTSQPL